MKPDPHDHLEVTTKPEWTSPLDPTSLFAVHAHGGARAGQRRLERLLGLVILLSTVAAFWPLSRCDFIYFDDLTYVVENARIRSGFTGSSLAWAFTTFHFANWHPLTWLSYMADFKLYGLNPAGYHLTNVLFHAGNALLLFLVLREATGRTWESAAVAGLFALHPLHVESVAWVSERKDVLSTFFWMLTLLTYIRYTRQHGKSWYGLTLVFFVLGLLSKPMLVTLPFVLLLLDYWPLARLHIRETGDPARSFGALPESTRSGLPFRRLLLEKVPFFLLSVASSIVTFMAQSQGGAVQSLETFSLKVRVLNALVSYVVYLLKAFCPLNLAIIYPHPGNAIELWQGLGAAGFLLALSMVVLQHWRTHPFVLVGWLWFLGTLVPVIGIVQVGAQALADRYTYVPLIGLFVAVVWWMSALDRNTASVPWRRFLPASVFFLLLAGCTWLQVSRWKDTTTLFEHALRVTSKNAAVHFILSQEYDDRRNGDQARFHYDRAASINPSLVSYLHNRTGYYMVEENMLEAAESEFRKALSVSPNYPNAHNNLGVVLARRGMLGEAVKEFDTVLKLSPTYSQARVNRENALRDLEAGRALRSGSEAPQ